MSTSLINIAQDVFTIATPDAMTYKLSNYDDIKQKMSPEQIATAQAKGNLIYRPIIKDDVATASDTTYDVSGGTWTNRMSKADKKKLHKNRKKQLKAMKAARAEK